MASDADLIWDETDTIYQIRVDLEGLRPPIWRRLQIPADYVLYWVHHVLQIAMGWQNAHLHLFRGQEMEICPVDYEIEGTIDETVVSLAELLPKVGDSAKYEYDFGDGWVLKLRLEKVLPADPDQDYPFCVEGRRAGPPEDVGGIYGYQSFLAATADPGHPDHDEYVAWFGDVAYDPEDFSPLDINAPLMDLGYIAVDRPADLDSHHMTELRQELISPDLLRFLGVITTDDTELAEADRQERFLQQSRTVTELLSILPGIQPGVFDLWSSRLLETGVDVGELVIDRLKGHIADNVDAGAQALWVNERLTLVLYRSVRDAVPLLVNAWDEMGPESRSLASLVFGLKGARETTGLVREHCTDMLEQFGYSGAIGAMWALVDLGDPMAADVLASAVVEAVEHGVDFPEIWPMLSRAGDARALPALIDLVVTSSLAWAVDARQAAACIAYRIGREGVLNALVAYYRDQEDDDPESEAEMLAELIYHTSEAEANAYFRMYFEPVPLEEMMAELDEAYDTALGWEASPWVSDELLWDSFSEDLSTLEQRVHFYDEEDEATPADRRLKTPGTNDPCWCGSGKRYKDCHWRLDQADRMGRVQTG